MAILKTTVSQGEIQGIKKDRCTLFCGVPYAQPPVGELRFQAPQPPLSWNSVYSADHFPNICWQDEAETDEFYNKEFYSAEEFRTAPSEDCLYLNIWTPAQAPGEKLPVALWIHGGAFTHGNGHESEFDGEAYCRRGVILVTMNYRLGVFGFLAHPWLSRKDPLHISGNYGCLDQIAALKWVHENISAFGGDPDNITLFGQSAGAMSTQTLVTSPLTKDLISRAIFQSAGGYRTGFNQDLTLAQAEKYGEDFTAFSGIASPDALYALEAGELCRLASAYMKSRPEHLLTFVPNIDGHLLTDGYDSCIEHGQVRDIPYLLGSTLNDLAVDVSPAEEGPRGRLYYGCIGWSHMLEKLGRAPAYVYDFQRQLPGDDAGAFHSSELWYTFGTLGRCWRPMTDKDRALSGRMLDCWTNFMKYGNPNGSAPADIRWRPCRKADPYVQIFDA